MSDIPKVAFIRLLRATLSLYGAMVAQRALFEMRDSLPEDLQRYSNLLDEELDACLAHINESLASLERNNG
jgi:hypothetical protein